MKQTSGFIELGISETLQEKLKDMGITVPTPVQEKTIPLVMSGENLAVQSPTGTGKTLAYLAPLLLKIEPDNKNLEIIILVPSRELAVQVLNLIRNLSGAGAVGLIGGASPERQLEALKNKPRIAVGTPGRVLELLKKRKINGQAVRAIVVDEVDKMLSAGFMGDVQAILKGTLRSRQVLFFSALISPEIQEAVSALAGEMKFIDLSQESMVPPTIRHQYIMGDPRNRGQMLCRLLHAYRPTKTIVFVQRNEGVGPLTGRLQEEGFAAGGLHSDLPQIFRKEILEKFRQGKLKILVTTDLLARGMDIADIDMIINYDLPIDSRHYLHRSGRTGRAGRAGLAVSLVPEEKKAVIHRYAGKLHISFEQIGLDGDRVFPVIYRKKKGR